MDEVHPELFTARSEGPFTEVQPVAQRELRGGDDRLARTRERGGTQRPEGQAEVRIAKAVREHRMIRERRAHQNERVEDRGERRARVFAPFDPTARGTDFLQRVEHAGHFFPPVGNVFLVLLADAKHGQRHRGGAVRERHLFVIDDGSGLERLRQRAD